MKNHLLKNLCAAAMTMCLASACTSGSQPIKQITIGSPLTMDLSTLQMPERHLISTMGGSNPDGDSIAVNNQFLTMNGSPWCPSYGELQFSRYPDSQWEDAILKLKAAGFYGVSTYVFWIHHEEIENKWNWAGSNNFRKFLQLCQKHDMKVFARIGPWVHGECAYGGHPKWLVDRLRPAKTKGHPGKGGKLRSTHPEYMAAVEDLYRELADQMKGLYWKDGGPIFAIQLDNENSHHGKGRGAELLHAERELCRKLGIDAPIFTSTGWGGAEHNQDETIPVYGSYADNFWMKADTIVRGKSFSFMRIREDGDIGTDIGLGSKKLIRKNSIYKQNPYMTAESGCGMNMAFHRRTDVTPIDNGALSLVEIGSGCNAMGYYTFHGGRNPIGVNEYLNESLDTGVNSNSVISNDFQGAVGEFGQVRPSFGEYPLQLHFLADFGYLLAPCQTVIPAEIDPEQGGDYMNPKLLQYAVRTDGKQGFLFVNNHLMHDSMYVYKGVQFTMKMKDTEITFPSTPCTIHPSDYFMWPFNLSLQDMQLTYATAQPYCYLQDARTYVFAQSADIPVEIRLGGASVQAVRPVDACDANIEKTNGDFLVKMNKPGMDACVEVKTPSGKLRILVLTAEQARRSYKYSDHLYVTDNVECLLENQKKMQVISTASDAHVAVYPTRPLGALQGTSSGVFTQYDIAFDTVDIPLSYKQIQDGKEMQYTLPMRRGKVGVPDDEVFDKGSIIQFAFPQEIPSNLYDVRIAVDYRASCLRFYRNGVFEYDNYYNGHPWIFSSKHLMKDRNDKMLLKFLPLQPNDALFTEGIYWPDYNYKHNVLDINDLRTIPVYSRSF